MARSASYCFDIAASPRQVMVALTSEGFLVPWNRDQDHVRDVRVEVVSRDNDSVVIDIKYVEYARGASGINRKKTVRTSARISWDLHMMRCQWTYRSADPDRVKVHGTDLVEPSDSGTRVTCSMTVDIKVPLLGGTIEKSVLKDRERRQPVFERLLREACSTALRDSR